MVPVRASYFGPVMNPQTLKQVTDAVAEQVGKIKECDAIAVTGNSGALVASAIAIKTDKPIVLVRKGDRDTFKHHSGLEVEGATKVGLKYVFVDDFICSGATVERVLDKMSKEMTHSECIGIILYQDGRGESEWGFGGQKVPLYKVQPNFVNFPMLFSNDNIDADPKMSEFY